MIKMSLHPTQSGMNGFTPREVNTTDELVIINEMMDEGLTVHARTFQGPDRRSNITVFWTTDADGHVATLWEHTYQVLSFNVAYGLAEESAVLQEADTVTQQECAATTDDMYARGEA